MRSLWRESDRDGCLSILLALALPLEQRPKLSFLTLSAFPLQTGYFEQQIGVDTNTMKVI